MSKVLRASRCHFSAKSKQHDIGASSMSELDDLLRQKAEIEARIFEVRMQEIDRLRLEFAELAYKLRELNGLPKPLVDVFTDKAGTFNSYRVMSVKKP
ncbi:hypothetical protein QTL95_10640 [Rhizobium sp. S152]|uniref:hypothetical protein n=1 Tax=Rhizobium sp. S152 TaxID=3055038 RepID=UPI0025A94B40|nr:hypothetical protein [Rhizobium sp. S152]MDM9626355.1 hypothetical protein [Rhizobium sp. S152]